MAEPSTKKTATVSLSQSMSGRLNSEDRRRMIESARLPNGSYDLDSVAVRAFDAHIDRELADAGRTIDPEIKYAMYEDVVDPSDRWAVYRITEDMRSGEQNDPEDRVSMVAINYNLGMAIHPSTTQFTRELKFFKSLDEAKDFYNRRK